MTFNVRSLIDASRRIDLNNTLIFNKIDFGFIQECHLKKNKKVTLKGYNFLYDNSPIGVGIAIKETISYNHFNISGLGFFGSFIKIELNSNNISKQILTGSLYIPCNFPITDLYNGLNKILDAASSFDGFILGGDLNAKHAEWGDIAENSNGKTLHNWLQDHSMEIFRLCDSTPSYPNGSSFLDHFLVSASLINNSDQNFKTSTLPSFSDHFPVML